MLASTLDDGPLLTRADPETPGGGMSRMAIAGRPGRRGAVLARGAFACLAFIVVAAACGGGSKSSSPPSRSSTSSPSSLSPTTDAKPVTTTTHPATIVTEADGFRFGVQPGAVTKVVKVKEGLLDSAVAPPGQTYLSIPITLINEQTDRGAPVTDLTGSTPTSVLVGLPAGQPPAADCVASDPPFPWPARVCNINNVDVNLPDGSDLASLGAGTTPDIPAGGRYTIHASYGPISTNIALAGLALYVEVFPAPTATGSGTLVAVPIPAAP
jgi:hypothetical protein